MGVSTNGQICFGLIFDEGHEFPWNAAGQGLDDWWRDQSGYKPSKVVYDDSGNYMPGITKDDIDAHYKERREWDAAHPCPVEEVNYCSGDCEMFILAIPATVKTARRGYPVVINRDLDFEFKPGDRKAFLDFIEKYECYGEHLPAWYLSSLWN